MTVRRAVPDDARGIAEVQVGTWRVAYAGLVDDDLLDGLSVDERARQFQAWLGGDGSARHFVADENGIVGFATVVTPARDAELGVGVAEVAAIYVLADCWRDGVGTALMDATVASLRADGYDAVVLWVLEQNTRARAFYAARGFAEDGAERTEPRLQLPELRYRVALSTG